MKNNVLVLLFICIIPIALQAQNDNIGFLTTYIQKGDSLIELENKGENARLMYRKAISIDNMNPFPFHKMAQSFVKDYRIEGKDNYLDSIILYENKARLLDPKFKEAYNWEVIAYREKWRHGMIRKVVFEALQHFPEDPDIHLLIGRNYFDTGNPGLALPYLEKAIELGGENAPGAAYRFIGWCWFYLEKHDRQLEYFNKFREIDPKSLMGIAGQIHSYSGLKKFDRATELAIQIKEENPDHVNSANLEAYIGETLLFGNKYDEAISYYEKALEINPTAENLFGTRAVTTTLGYLYLQNGRKQEGEKLLNQTIQRRLRNWDRMPERWEYSFDIASAYAAMGDLDNAYQWLYTTVLTGYPGHLWKMDPVFSACHQNFPFEQLILQARKRVEGELGD